MKRLLVSTMAVALVVLSLGAEDASAWGWRSGWGWGGRYYSNSGWGCNSCYYPSYYSSGYGYYGNYNSYPGFGGYYGNYGMNLGYGAAYGGYGYGNYGAGFAGANLLSVLTAGGNGIAGAQASYVSIPLGNGFGQPSYLQLPVGGAAGRPSYMQVPVSTGFGQSIFMQIQLGPAASTNSPALSPGTPAVGYLPGQGPTSTSPSTLAHKLRVENGGADRANSSAAALNRDRAGATMRLAGYAVQTKEHKAPAERSTADAWDPMRLAKYSELHAKALSPRKVAESR
jgi:hypothetical protein